MLFTLQRYEFFSKSQRLVIFYSSILRCCLPCKGTNFLANHNRNKNNYVMIWMLFTLQRYEFFSKSQHKPSNQMLEYDVVYLAKVRIFQQITTRPVERIKDGVMLFTLQRYEFFSKSQLDLTSSYSKYRCCLPCKGTNFLANHNVR